MFSRQALVATRLFSISVAAAMTLATLLCLNLLASSEYHAQQLAAQHVVTTSQPA